MLNVAIQLMAQGWSLSCWASTWNPTSDHPQSRACDVFPGRGGALPTREQRTRGNALTDALQARRRSDRRQLPHLLRPDLVRRPRRRGLASLQRRRRLRPRQHHRRPLHVHISVS